MNFLVVIATEGEIVYLQTIYNNAIIIGCCHLILD
jgi:hypothetical protein